MKTQAKAYYCNLYKFLRPLISRKIGEKGQCCWCYKNRQECLLYRYRYRDKTYCVLYRVYGMTNPADSNLFALRSMPAFLGFWSLPQETTFPGSHDQPLLSNAGQQEALSWKTGLSFVCVCVRTHCALSDFSAAWFISNNKQAHLGFQFLS